MCFRETDSVLSSGTGFIYKYDNDYYLVTNWHNVSGRNPETGKCLSVKTLAVPDMISTLFRTKEQPANCRRESILLYSDDSMFEPIWYEHPEFGKAVDVVAIKIPIEICANYKLFAINECEFDLSYKEMVADDAFVIGYPFSDITYLGNHP